MCQETKKLEAVSLNDDGSGVGEPEALNWIYFLELFQRGSIRKVDCIFDKATCITHFCRFSIFDKFLKIVCNDINLSFVRHFSQTAKILQA